MRDDKATRNGQQKRWQDDRSWDVIKWVGGVSAGICVIAAIAFVGSTIGSVG